MLGFIGAGSMGGAIMRGVIAAEAENPENIYFTRINDAAAAALRKELGVKRAESNSALISEIGGGSVAILGVKPYLAAEVLEEIAENAAKHSTVIVSVAAGISLEKLGSALAPKQPIVRAMPNVASSIRNGMTALCPNQYVSAEQLTAVRKIFAAIGEIAVIPEKDFLHSLQSPAVPLPGHSPISTHFRGQRLQLEYRKRKLSGLPRKQSPDQHSLYWKISQILARKHSSIL
ncbi:NAD(P)-binding domain-containing protein [Arcanobacterium hippocoleae]